MLPARLPSREELLAILKKYEVIGELRRERAEGAPVAARRTLRALAREFPGALRELDTLTIEEIDERTRALARAAEEGPIETWMTWMVAYHAMMRAALCVKARTANSSDLSPASLASLRAEALRCTGLAIDDEFVRSVARPPQGRLNRTVFERLGRDFGVSPDQIRQTLFVGRRPARSTMGR